jgi:hypothetical protein
MNTQRIRILMRRSLLGLGAIASIILLTPSQSKASEAATAAITATQIAPGENQFSLTLNDTGTTTIGTFWFSWIPGDNFMPVAPTSITSPAGWVDNVTSGGPSGGSAIQWEASSSVNDLSAGNSLSGFSFDSSLTLGQLEAPSTGHPSDPVFTSTVYSGAPFSDAGVQLTPGVAPEPAEIWLVGLGLAIVATGTLRKVSKTN